MIFNEQYSKEEYEKKKEELALNTRSGVQDLKKKFEAFILDHPRKYMHGYSNDDVTGDYVANCRRCYDTFMSSECEDVHHAFGMWDCKDSQDYYYWGLHF